MDVQTTSLIHEAWLRLGRERQWNDELHFLLTASRAMRFVMVDAARARLRLKRQAPAAEVAEPAVSDQELLDIGEALERLGAMDRRLTQVVDCRFFAGFADEETARILGIDVRTVRRDWAKAKAWLQRELGD